VPSSALGYPTGVKENLCEPTEKVEWVKWLIDVTYKQKQRLKLTFQRFDSFRL
jgi:hypothetical protein